MRQRMPGMISDQDMMWVKPAIKKLREKWSHNIRGGAEETQIPYSTFNRWITGQYTPSRTSLRAFRRACEISGIEVPK